uniref:Uncharacterized protein n=1 Tax=Candidatus Kentrum sp. LPFa TaxID=2126335 RepID=A0A450WIR0_9GAMM|nr:MAG: hypothetical protein BECKLPF1236A_GA0070988_101572 [Candidatus Kentron sp. LPFa]VFK32054.1 MAG: hypothetical protein BECKLPF1236C_GA0070990_101561 [Candidatus Kentron sp. LPFa]
MPERDVDGLSGFRIFETDEFRKRRKLPEHDARFVQRELTEYVYPRLRMNPFFGSNIKKHKGYRVRGGVELVDFACFLQ